MRRIACRRNRNLHIRSASVVLGAFLLLGAVVGSTRSIGPHGESNSCLSRSQSRDLSSGRRGRRPGNRRGGEADRIPSPREAFDSRKSPLARIQQASEVQGRKTRIPHSAPALVQARPRSMRSPGSKADGALPVDRPARRPSLTGGRPSSRPSSHLQDKTAESLAALDDTVSQLCRRVRGGSVSERSVPAVPKGASPSTAPVALQTGDGPPSMASTLVTVKLLFLLFYGSLGAVMPYLPVYYHSLGLPDKQIGMLGAITPAVTFVVAPLWGALADQTGRHKDVLLFTFVASVVSRLLFIWRTTFGWLAILVFCTAVLNAPVRPLLDSSVLNLLEDKREYGKQRLWGQFGFGLAGCIVGPCLMNHKFGGYKAAFYVHALISLPTLLIMRRFNPTPPAPAPSSPPLPVASTNKSEKPSMAKEEGPGAVALPSKAPSAALSSQPAKPRFREGLGIVVRNPDALIFFFLVFVIGVSSGVIENFAYKRLREVGGEGTVMGVSRFFSSVTGVPMFWFSGHVTRRLSVMGVLILSLCSYILRFFIYASITNPWQGLPAEALRGFTFAAMWASSTYYTHKISPPGLSATMLGFLNGMYGGLGQSTGALIGGGLSHRVGTPRTFVLAGLADIVVVICFGTYWWLHPNATRLKEE